MATGSQNMTTFNAKHIIGDSTNVDWAGALLHSGRDGKTSSIDTWIFADDYGSTSSNYGIKHNQTEDTIEFVGASSARTIIHLGKSEIVASHLVGGADTWYTARTLTIGDTGKSVNGSANVSWSKDEILGTSTDAYFLRGDKVWSNTLNGVLLLPKGLKTGSRVSDSGSGIVIDNDGGIEIFHTSTPFIDFHYQASTADYSVRLMCDSATNIHDSGSFTTGKYITAKGDITANGGYLYSTLNGNTVQIGSQNGSYAHFTNTKDIPFWFNKVIQSDGGFTIYNTGDNHWRNGYIKINNSSGGDCYVELRRSSNADWRILNSGGNLYFQSNYTSSKVAYFNVLQLDYNTGRAHFKEYVYASYFNASCGAEAPADGSYWIFANSDGFFRKSTRANLASKIDIEHKWVRIGGDTMTGDLLFSNSGTTTRQIRGIVGDNDYWRVAGGATAANAGWVEIATADDGNEPVYARQYTGAFTTIKRTLTLLDANGNTNFPGYIYRAGVSKSWINGRDNAIIRTTSYNGYDAILSMKTTNGAWELGVYSSNEMFFTYTPDSNYNSGTNSGYTHFRFNPNGYMYGNFSGYLSGNISGSSSSCTGNSATTSKLSDSAHSWTATEVYNYMTARVLKAGDSMNGRLSIANADVNPGTSPSTATIEVREAVRKTTGSDLPHTAQNSPRIGFHWGSRYWAQLAFFNSAFRFYNASLDGYVGVYASRFYGAVTGDVTGNCSGSAGSVAWANVSSKPATATRWPSWSEVTSKPAVQNNLTSTSTTDVLSAAQGKALNDNKTAKGTGLAYTALLNQTYAGTSYKSITVSNISSYNALYFACYFSSFWRGSMLIPISDFKSNQVTIFFMINGSTPEYANFKYISDTSIQISTDYGHSLVFRIWGAKTS